jgi:transcriptional regulator with XRE-family HTH domain
MHQEFVEAVAELEPGYQIARLSIAQGLTQAQLAKKVGTTQRPAPDLSSAGLCEWLIFLRAGSLPGLSHHLPRLGAR